MKESVITGVVVPSLQALITGLFTGLAAWALGMLTRWDRSGLIALAMGAGVALITWSFAARHGQRLLELREGIDLQPDSQPLPGGQPEPIRAVIVSENGQQGDYLDLPCNQEQLIALAAGMIRGESFSLGAWTGHGRPFSRADFERLRAELLARGALAWRNPSAPAQGLTLSQPGKALMRYYASMAAGRSPTLADHHRGEPPES
jgi:hypothetical protein